MTRFLSIPGVVRHKDVGSQRLASYFRGLYRRATQGDGEAQWEVGVNLFEHDGAFKRAPKKAITWFRRALDNGYTPASNNLAFAFLTGTGVVRDAKRAIELYQVAIDAGDLAALWNLGKCYLSGSGVRRDIPSGIKLLRRSANEGFYLAAVDLAALYEGGEVVRKNAAESVRWLKVAAHLADDADDADATRRLALAYERGWGVKRSVGTAFRLMERAATMGNVDAWHVLGWYFHQGIGVRRNSRAALKWYKKAARTGDSISAFDIGVIYWDGGKRGLATSWFKKAASLGHRRSSKFLLTRREELLFLPEPGLGLIAPGGC